MTVRPASSAIDRRTTRDNEDHVLARRGHNFIGLWTLYVLTLRQHIHGKRWIIMLLLFLLPAGLADLIRIVAPREVPSTALEFAFGFALMLHLVVPLAALIYASGIIQDEQEYQTITYLLIRPLPKWAIYSVKLVATITAMVGLTCVFTIVTYASIFLGATSGTQDIVLRCLKAMLIHSLAMTSYCCVFGCMVLLTTQIRALVLGIVYVVAIEFFVSVYALGVRSIAIDYYIRLITCRWLDFTFTIPRIGRSENPAAEFWRLDIRADPLLADHPTTRTCVIVLLSACLALTLLAAFICSRREFHVKTPEKN